MQRLAITLCVSPARITVTEMTPLSSGWALRVRIVWNACTIWQAIGIGSTPLCGIAAWAPRPTTSMWNSLFDAKAGPLHSANCPTPRPGQLCAPKMASIGKRSKSPSSIITRAPPPPSSAGWKTK